MTVDELRSQGYAVVIFSPDELRGAEPHSVENSLIESAWDIISVLADN
jgi:hypothetical protein